MNQNKKLKGIMLVLVTMMIMISSTFITRAEGITGIEVDDLTLFPGEEYTIKRTDGDDYDIEGFSFVASADGVTVSEDGVIQADSAITEKKEVWLKITVSYKRKVTADESVVTEETKKVNYFCIITVIPLDLDEAFKPLASGLTRDVVVQEYTSTKITFDIEDKNVATIENGVLKALSAGTTKITVIKNVDGVENTEEYQFTVTDPKFIRESDAIAEFGNATIKELLSGTCEQSAITDLVSSKPSKIKVDGMSISGVKKCGSVVISCIVDGRELKATFTVTRSRPKEALKQKANKSDSYYYYSCKPVIVQKGKKSTFKTTGMSSVSHAEYTNYGPDIASVSDKGVVKGKKYGSSHFIVRIDYREYYITTVVAKKKAVQVLKKAYTTLGKNYSQPRRMDKNYYDCSSLVYRVFKPYGIDFGVNGWAPTADMEAYYMYTHGKMKYHKGVSYKKLKPGDIVFFGPRTKGSYGDIYHVAIYVGDDTIIHAAGTAYGVIQSKYSDRKKSVGCIARPF